VQHAAAAVALMVIVAEAIAPGAPVGVPPPLRRGSAACTERGLECAVGRNVWPA
jgi:hypothetical protein